MGAEAYDKEGSPGAEEYHFTVADKEFALLATDQNGAWLEIASVAENDGIPAFEGELAKSGGSWELTVGAESAAEFGGGDCAGLIEAFIGENGNPFTA